MIIVIVPMIVTNFLSMWVTLNRIEADLKSSGLQALRNAQFILLEYTKRAENISELLSGIQEVKGNLNNPERVQEFLDNKHDLWFTAIIEVFDSKKKLLPEAI